MKNVWMALLAALLFAGAAGCAATDRQPDCRGPWAPINASPQVRADG